MDPQDNPAGSTATSVAEQANFADTSSRLWFDFRHNEELRRVGSGEHQPELKSQRQLDLDRRIASLREFWSMRGPGIAWCWGQQFPDLPQFELELFGVFPQVGGAGGWFSARQVWMEALLHDVHDQLPELARLLFLVVGCGWWQRSCLSGQNDCEDWIATKITPWRGFAEQSLVLALRIAGAVDLVEPSAQLYQRARVAWGIAAGTTDSAVSNPQRIAADSQQLTDWLDASQRLDTDTFRNWTGDWSDEFRGESQ